MNMKNKQTSPTSTKRGFTIVEVMLTLAITAALFAAVMGSTVSSIYRSRYSDSVNDIVDRLRSIYSEVINTEIGRVGSSAYDYCSVSSAFVGGHIVSNANGTTEFPNYPGRTGCAVYGKLVTIGETTPSSSVSIDSNMIRTYDVIGNIDDKKLNNSNVNSSETVDRTIEALKAVGANVVTYNTNPSTNCSLVYAGQYDQYSPFWQARIEKTSDNDLLQAALLIIRSPLTGTVHTYVYKNNATINVQDYLYNPANAAAGAACASASSYINSSRANSLVKKALEDNDFSNSRKLELCVGSEDAMYYDGNRRGIRILPDGQNASAVELINMDSEDNPCL